ncbi:helix-turn-helix domain-containing protein [Amycolatopsis sp. NBC_01480]|uniref:helix-turn-helix domain-containing protein n=1 Tax=Amycolatopsis sp. NBC_01480 TaxID=2903562 RepID=UPI002E2D9FA3|nr:helix-turn-helix transcriptional regulator [Amycolatopsis sp. NBC_01480]
MIDLVNELRQFGTLLREWRGRIPPADVDSSGGEGVRRTPGLRREELAELSDMSTDYIRRLEQGRSRPSLRVSKSMAGALALSPAEYEHLCILTGHAIAQPGRVNRLIGPASGGPGESRRSCSCAACRADMRKGFRHEQR